MLARIVIERLDQRDGWSESDTHHASHEAVMGFAKSSTHPTSWRSATGNSWRIL